MKEYQAILADLKKGDYKPVYFLEGEEGFFIDRISNYIEEHALDEAAKAFDQTVVYGKDSKIDNILSMAREFPISGDRRVLIVKEAQHLKDIQNVAAYLGQVQPSTILVFCYKYKKLDRRTALGKLISKKTVLFTAKKLRDYQMPDLAVRYLKSKRRHLSASNAQLITEHLGNDLGRVVNELDKLLIITADGQDIDGKIIEENIGISRDHNIFELQKALGQRDPGRAFMIAAHFNSNPKDHPYVLSINLLFDYFNKLLQYHYLLDKGQGAVAKELRMNPYFVKDTASAARNYSVDQLIDIHSLMREYDLKGKGIGSTGAVPHGELLRELIYKVLN